uniref:Bestrophin homolog n=1 Tax=Romanomermis culicivorax TaxID=13658 RepID=A0A915J3J8_ROMCU
MTISYSDNFGKLLLRWKGSLWKAVWRDLSIFLILYYVINFSYRFAMDDHQRAYFRKLVIFCDKSSQYIPLNFLLGFFVSTVVARWWEQCNWLTWPDKMMTYVTTYIRGEKYLVLRRTVARWMNLSSALCWRNLSRSSDAQTFQRSIIRTIKRFPTLQHFVTAGLMTDAELKTYETVDAPHGKWWVPLVWVVAIATYGYFAICLVGRQIVGEPDVMFPIFTTLQFLFYVGWLKVGEDLMNPFGEVEFLKILQILSLIIQKYQLHEGKNVALCYKDIRLGNVQNEKCNN